MKKLVKNRPGNLSIRSIFCRNENPQLDWGFRLALTIVEVFSDTQFLADVGDDPSTWETIGITIDDIKEVI